MTNKLSIIFMGTPDFAVPTLESIIIKSTYRIVGVVTQPDRPGGRGLKMIAPPVKKIAQKYDITYIQPEKIRKKNIKEWLRNCEPDVIVVVAYGKILPKSILEIPKKGCINVHASLLPEYRGAAPINWCLINGEYETGITTMLMDEGMDTGDILLQKSIIIDENENAQSIHDRLAQIGAELLIETLNRLVEGSLSPTKQDDSSATYAPMLDKEIGRIDWNKSAIEVHNLVRGLSPWPGAYTFFRGIRIKIYETNINKQDCDHSQDPGAFITLDKDNGLLVQTGNGTIWLKTLQPASKSRMPAQDFYNGYRCSPQDSFTSQQ